MSWSLQAGGHGNVGSATVYAPYKEAYYLSSLPLDELAEKIIAYLKQANQEAEEREAAASVPVEAPADAPEAAQATKTPSDVSTVTNPPEPTLDAS